MTVQIEIRGPGETMGDIVQLLIKCLKDAGVVVNVTDAYPPMDTPIQIHAGRVVDLHVKHLPWGG